MIILERLRIKNGIVWEELDISLENQGTIFLTGSNGTGKSSIGELLTHIIYGKTNNGFKGNGVVRPGCSSFLAELYFRINDVSYKIVQSKKTKSASFKVHIFQKEHETDVEYLKEISPKKSQGRSNEIHIFIAKLLGLSQQGFTGVSYLSQDTSHILIKGTGTQKKEYISSLFNLNKYDLYKDIITKKYKEISKRKDEIFVKEAVLQNIEEQLLEYPEDLEDTKANLTENLSAIKLKIQKREEKIKNTESYFKQKIAINKKLKEAELTLKQSTNKLLIKEETSIKQLRVQLKEVNKSLLNLNTLKKNVISLKKLKVKKDKYNLTVTEAIKSKATKSKKLKVLTEKKDILLIQGTAIKNFIPLLEDRLELDVEVKDVFKDICALGYTIDAKKDIEEKLVNVKDKLAVSKNFVKSVSNIKGNICPTCHREYSDKGEHLNLEKEKIVKLQENLKSLKEVVSLLQDYTSLSTDRGKLDNDIITKYPDIKGAKDFSLEKWNTLLLTTRSEFKEIKKQFNDLTEEVLTLTSSITELTTIEESILEYSDVDITKDYNNDIENTQELADTLNINIETSLNKISIIKDILLFKDAFLNIKNLYTEERLIKAKNTLLKLQNKKEVGLQALGEISNQIKSYKKLIIRKSETTTLISDKDSVLENFLVYEALQKAVPKLKERLLHNILVHMQEVLPQYINIMFEGQDDLEFVVSDSENSIDLFKRVYVEDTYYDVPVKGLSKGERQRLGLCIVWTLHKILHNHKRVDFLMLDEVDQGLDQDGMVALKKLIEEKKNEVGTLILISHRLEIKDIKIDRRWTAVSVDNITSKLITTKSSSRLKKGILRNK